MANLTSKKKVSLFKVDKVSDALIHDKICLS